MVVITHLSWGLGGQLSLQAADAVQGPAPRENEPWIEDKCPVTQLPWGFANSKFNKSPLHIWVCSLCPQPQASDSRIEGTQWALLVMVPRRMCLRSGSPRARGPFPQLSASFSSSKDLRELTSIVGSWPGRLVWMRVWREIVVECYFGGRNRPILDYFLRRSQAQLISGPCQLLFHWEIWSPRLEMTMFLWRNKLIVVVAVCGQGTCS